MEPACGVDQDHIYLLFHAGCYRIEGYRCWVSAFLAAHGIGANAAAPRLKLISGRSTESIGRAQKDLVAHGYQHASKLAGGCGFTGAIDTDDHDDCWLALIRHGLNGAIHLWVTCLNEAFAQHGTCLILAGNAALCNLFAQGISHLHRGLGAQIRHDERVFDFLPGVFIQIACGQNSHEPLADGILRARKASTQTAKTSTSGCDIILRSWRWSRFSLWNLGLFLGRLGGTGLCLGCGCGFFGFLAVVHSLFDVFGIIVFNNLVEDWGLLCYLGIFHGDNVFWSFRLFGSCRLFRLGCSFWLPSRFRGTVRVRFFAFRRPSCRTRYACRASSSRGRSASSLGLWFICLISGRFCRLLLLLRWRLGLVLLSRLCRLVGLRRLPLLRCWLGFWFLCHRLVCHRLVSHGLVCRGISRGLSRLWLSLCLRLFLRL